MHLADHAQVQTGHMSALESITPRSKYVTYGSFSSSAGIDAIKAIARLALRRAPQLGAFSQAS